MDQEETSPYIYSENNGRTQNNERSKPDEKTGQNFWMENINVIIIIIVLILVFIYYSTSSSTFLNPGYRDDPEMDDSYLDTQIEFLNKMQARNLSL